MAIIIGSIIMNWMPHSGASAIPDSVYFCIHCFFVLLFIGCIKTQPNAHILVDHWPSLCLALPSDRRLPLALLIYKIQVYVHIFYRASTVVRFNDLRPIKWPVKIIYSANAPCAQLYRKHDFCVIYDRFEASRFDWYGIPAATADRLELPYKYLYKWEMCFP